jgi:hypothetical protein
MAEIVRLKPETTADAILSLTEVINKGGIVGVAAVAIHENGAVTRIISNNIDDRIRLIGALECLKHDLLPDRICEGVE